MEGHFTQGGQDSFGRTLQVQKTQATQFYIERLEFIGWWARFTSGIGAAKKDNDDHIRGTWNANGGYPNQGRSWAQPSGGDFTSQYFETLAYAYIY